MKLNQIIHVFRFKSFLAGALSAIILVFFLTSCCTAYEASFGKRDCNCREKNLAKKGNQQIEQATKINTVQAESSLPQPSGLNNNQGSVTTISDNDISNMKVKMDDSPENKKGPLGIKAINSHIIAGPNASLLTGKSEGLKKKGGLGFQFGVGSNYIFSRKFSVNAALFFKQNNFSTTEGEGDYATKIKYAYNFLSAHALARFVAGKNLQVGVGPEITYLLSATSRASYGEGGDADKEKITEQSVRLGLGIQGNVSYEFSKKFGIQLALGQRLNNLNKKSSDYGGNYTADVSTLFNATFSFFFNFCPQALERMRRQNIK